MLVITGDWIKQILTNKSIGHVEPFYEHFSLNMSKNFRYQQCLSFFEILGEVLVVDDVWLSNKHEIYPNASVDENCIEVEFQGDHFYCVELRQFYVSLKLKGNGTY